jgi:hypothetical protein
MKLTNNLLLVLVLIMHETIPKFLHASSGCGMSLSTRITVPQLTAWSRVILEKLTGFQLVKKFPALYGTQSSVLHSREPYNNILLLVTLFPPTDNDMQDD